MKCNKTKLLAFLLLIVTLSCFAFSGCNIMGASDANINEILQPPTPDEEKYKIKMALDKETKGTVTLVSPKSGSFVSAYNQYDIDGDGIEEAIVFYKEKINGRTALYVHLFVKKDGEWVSSSRFMADGSDVFSLSFYDLDGDKAGVCEIIVAWEQLGTQNATKKLVIYHFENNEIEKYPPEECKECDDVAFVDLIPGDDGILEIVTFTIEKVKNENNEDKSVAKAHIYSCYERMLRPHGEIELGDGIIGFAKVSSNSEKEIDGIKYFPRVVVDCYYLEYQKLKTVMIYWNPNSLSPLKTETDDRMSDITSRDINLDGVIEIPAEKSFANETDEHIVEWQYYNNAAWRRAEYTFLDSKLNYMIKIPDEWIEDIAIEKNNDNEYVFYKWDKEADKSVGEYMKVKVFKSSRWEEIKNMYEHTLVRTNETGTLVYVLVIGDYGAPDGLDLLISK